MGIHVSRGSRGEDQRESCSSSDRKRENLFSALAKIKYRKRENPNTKTVKGKRNNKRLKGSKAK